MRLEREWEKLEVCETISGGQNNGNTLDFRRFIKYYYKYKMNCSWTLTY